MRKIILLIAILFPFALSAQDNVGINFEKGSWSEALEKAKQTGKPIFLDCYTTWCGPCKKMAAEVFVEKNVGDYFNANFINMKIDMEKGEGIELRKKYQISVFPTLLFIDSSGEVIGRMIGGTSDPKVFLGKVKKELQEKSLYTLKKRYEAGERSEELIFQYLKALEAAYLSKDAQMIVLDYFKDKNDYVKLNEKKYFILFEAFVTDVDSDIFKYVHKNRVEFANKYTKRTLDNKLYQVWLNQAVKFVKKGENGQYTFDEKGFDKFITRMKKEKVDYLPVIVANAKISNASKLEKWQEYVELVEERIKNPNGVEISLDVMVTLGRGVVNKCTDAQLRRRCIPIFEYAKIRIEDLKEQALDKKATIAETIAKSQIVMKNEKVINQIIEELKK